MFFMLWVQSRHMYLEDLIWEFFHKSVKIVKSHFSLSVKCYEHDDSKMIFPIDNFYGTD